MKKITTLMLFLMIVAPALAMQAQHTIDIDVTFKDHLGKQLNPVRVMVPVAGQIDASDPGKTNVPNHDIVQILNLDEAMHEKLTFGIFRIDNHGNAEMIIQAWSKKCGDTSQHMSTPKAGSFCLLSTKRIAKGGNFEVVVPESGEVIATVHRIR